jgi:hypothetical protein
MAKGALTPPIKITHPAFFGFLLKAAVSGFSLHSCFPFLAIGSYFKSGGYTMYNTENKRFYSPQFSETASVSVRRFAWFLNKPMTQAIEKIIQLLPFIMDSSKVCQSCKDSRKCNSCAFNVKKMPEDEQYKILAAL